jgi:hypothetical protein
VIIYLYTDVCVIYRGSPLSSKHIKLWDVRCLQFLFNNAIYYVHVIYIATLVDKIWIQTHSGGLKIIVYQTHFKDNALDILY